MKIGNRIIFDQDGDIITELGEMQGDVLPRKKITKIDFLDLEYGSIDHSKYRIICVDVSTKQPILEEIPQVLTPEQQQIKELEDALLLAADAEVGGIL